MVCLMLVQIGVLKMGKRKQKCIHDFVYLRYVGHKDGKSLVKQSICSKCGESLIEEIIRGE